MRPANLTDRRRRVIRADGTVQLLPQPQTMEQILKLLGTDTVDSVNLRHMGEPLMVMVRSQVQACTLPGWKP